MSKREFVFSMILGAVAVVFCLFAAFTGVIKPQTTTPWFWFVMAGVFLVGMMLEHYRYKRQ